MIHLNMDRTFLNGDADAAGAVVGGNAVAAADFAGELAAEVLLPSVDEVS